MREKRERREFVREQVRESECDGEGEIGESVCER